MGRSQKWPDPRSLVSKIRDISFVGTDELIIFWKFHNFPWNIVAVARLESYFVVGLLDLTWWPHLTWDWVEIFTKVAEKIGGKVGENPAALRAAVFSLASKNLRGGGVQTPPPPAGRGLNHYLCISGATGTLVLAAHFTRTSPSEANRAAALRLENGTRQVGLTPAVAYFGPARTLPVIWEDEI